METFSKKLATNGAHGPRLSELIGLRRSEKGGSSDYRVMNGETAL